jgi:methionyl-tRNA formyltransferase
MGYLDSWQQPSNKMSENAMSENAMSDIDLSGTTLSDRAPGHLDLINKPIKVALFASSSITIRVINKMDQEQLLVGVIIAERHDPDNQQLEGHLQQADIPYIRYQTDNQEYVLQQIKRWEANAGLIFTYSHKLPASILMAFSAGLYNLHASSLPLYRGAMPLYWQLRNNETQGTLSMIKVEQEVDSGDILLQHTFPRHPLDTLTSFAFTMAEYSADFVVQFFAQLKKGELIAKPQRGEISDAPMPTQQDLMINWNTMTGRNIVSLASAGNPQFNGAIILWPRGYIGLLQATVVSHPNYGIPAGSVLHVGEPEGLIIATVDGALRLDILSITEGIFTGITFAERFKLDAGVQFSSALLT